MVRLVGSNDNFPTTSRRDVFLAMVAGADVSVDRLIPPVAINDYEELMMAVATRFNNIEAAEAPVATNTEVEQMLIRVLG